MSVPDAKRLRELETENARLKKLLAEAMLENEVTREALRNKVVTAPARRLLVRSLVERGLMERRALAVVRMSASAFRYEPRPDRTAESRVIKCLTIVADATHEAVAIEVERAISGHGVGLYLIEPWRRECNEERSKKALGGLTPVAYAKWIAEIGYPNPGL